MKATKYGDKSWVLLFNRYKIESVKYTNMINVSNEILASNNFNLIHYHLGWLPKYWLTPAYMGYKQRWSKYIREIQFVYTKPEDNMNQVIYNRS